MFKPGFEVAGMFMGRETPAAIEQVRHLLDTGHPPDFDFEHPDRVAKEGELTALYWAVTFGNLTTTQMLLDAGARVNHKVDGEAAIFEAVKVGNPAMLRILIAAGADTASTRDNGRLTALHVSALQGSPNCIRKLVRAGWDVEARSTEGVTPLFLACQNQNLRAVQELLKAGTNPGTPFQNGRSCLYQACSFGSLEIVQELLRAGALPNVTNHDSGLTPLGMAAHNGFADIVRELLKLPLEALGTFTQLWATMRAAVIHGQHESLRVLLLGVNAVTGNIEYMLAGAGPPDYWTCLHYAAAYLRPKAFAYLLHSGATVDRLPSQKAAWEYVPLEPCIGSYAGKRDTKDAKAGTGMSPEGHIRAMITREPAFAATSWRWNLALPAGAMREVPGEKLVRLAVPVFRSEKSPGRLSRGAALPCMLRYANKA